MEDLNFFVDTNATEDIELLKTINSPFPIFSRSSYALGIDEGEEKSQESESEECFGELRNDLAI